MLADSLSYPFEDDDWLEKVGIGSGIMFVGFAFTPVSILLNGYYFRTFGAALGEASDLPEWGDWVEMAIDGLKMLVIGLLYAGIPSAVLFGTMFVFFFVFGLSLSAQSDVGVVVIGLLGLVVLAVETVVWLVALLLYPAAIGHTIAEDGLEHAFEIRDLVAIARQREYLAAVGLSFTVAFTISLIGSLFLIFLVGIPIVFYGAVVGHHLFGVGYRLSREPAGFDPIE